MALLVLDCCLSRNDTRVGLGLSPSCVTLQLQFSRHDPSELAPLEEIGPAQYVLPAIYPTDQMWGFEDAQFEHDLKDTGIES